tara:strand:+ start:1226 stop:1639 length:414 start_codon:yes stop_codon:yes gene_type:complete
MEKLFLEINQLKENKGYIQKDELLYFMKIQKNRIEIEEDKIRNILINMNKYCLTLLGNDCIKIQKEGLELYNKKNRDYGESYKQCGTIGILVRIIDKINRLENLKHISNYEVGETYKDTLIDLHNYTLLGIICIDGE